MYNVCMCVCVGAAVVVDLSQFMVDVIFVISDYWNAGVCLYASEWHQFGRNLCLG
jgi:hypothetical protein